MPLRQPIKQTVYAVHFRIAPLTPACTKTPTTNMYWPMTEDPIRVSCVDCVKTPEFKEKHANHVGPEDFFSLKQK